MATVEGNDQERSNAKKLGERLKKLSVLFEKVLCKWCESSPLDIELWKDINKHLSKEDAEHIVCFEDLFFLSFFAF